MVGYAGVRDAVESLVALLRAHITNSAEAGLSGVPVRADSPRELELLNVASAVSVWLHAVDVDADLVNRPATRPAPDQSNWRPLPLRLGVAVTPLNPDVSTRLLLLGRVAQVLDGHRSLTGALLVGDLASSGLTLRLTPDAASGYERAQLWSTQQTFARTTCCYHVSGLQLDPHHTPQRSPVVLAASARLSEIVGVD